MKSLVQYKSLVIGLGRIAQMMEGEKGRANPCTHCGAYNAHPRFLLCAGFDPDEKRCAMVEEKYKIPCAGENLCQWVQKQNPDILSLCTPCEKNLEIIKELHENNLLQNIQGILLEKPVGVNLSQAKEIETILGCYPQLKILVCHDRRFYPEFQQIQKLVKSKKYGNLFHIKGEICCSSFVKGRGRYTKSAQFGGPLIHDGTHLFDLFLWLLNSAPTHASALATRFQKNLKTEDTVMGSLFFENKSSASFLIGGRRNYFHFEFELGFEKAKLLYSHGRITLLVREKSPFLVAIPFETGSGNPYLLRLDHLVEMIEENKKPISSLKDGILCASVMDAIYRSCQNRGNLVSLLSEENPSFLFIPEVLS